MTDRIEALLADLPTNARDDLVWELLRHRPGPIPVPGGDPTLPQLMLLPLYSGQELLAGQATAVSALCQDVFAPRRLVIQERYAPRDAWQVHDARIGVHPQFYSYSAALPGRYCRPDLTHDFQFDTCQTGMEIVFVVSHRHPAPIEFRGFLLGYGRVLPTYYPLPPQA